MRDVADLDIERDKNRNHPTVEQAVKRGRVSQITQRRMEAVEGLPRTVNNRKARKTADAHASAANTRAIVWTAQGSRETVPAVRLAAGPETADLLEDDGQEIDIDIDF